MKALNYPLTQNKFALVDHDDFLWLCQWTWTFHNDGYAVRKSNKYDKIYIPGKNIFMHISLMKRWGKYIDGLFVDHEDLNCLNNTQINLRMSTKSENTVNKEPKSDNTSGYSGIRFTKNRWQVRITYNQVEIYCGRFETLEQAIQVRREAEVKYFGQFSPNKD